MGEIGQHRVALASSNIKAADDAVELFAQREDAERFLEDVRTVAMRDSPTRLRIEPIGFDAKRDFPDASHCGGGVASQHAQILEARCPIR